MLPLILLAVMLLAACQTPVTPDAVRLTSPPGEYSYPIESGYAASIVGTPPELRVELPREVPTNKLSLPPLEDRPIPRVFWYENRLRYSLAAQSGPAPLIFVIAGTNAGYSSRFPNYLQRLLNVAGFHVATLSSPTFPNFAVTASSTGVPGRVPQDAADLYAVMQRALKQIEERVSVTDVSLVGFSLGAMHAAFVDDIDRRERKLNFHRVLLLNPPVSVWRSVVHLDAMLVDNLPGGIAGLGPFLDRVFTRLSEVTAGSQSADFNEDFLVQAFSQLQPSDRELRALIGLVFRLAAANIAFTGDVLSNWGYIVPKDRVLRISTSLTPYFQRSLAYGFEDYFLHLMFPFYEARDPSLTHQEMIDEASLEAIAPVLASDERVDVITNADDIILAPGDLDVLQHIFGERLTLFPNGGHGGNLEERHVAAAIVGSMLR